MTKEARIVRTATVAAGATSINALMGEDICLEVALTAVAEANDAVIKVQPQTAAQADIPEITGQNLMISTQGPYGTARGNAVPSGPGVPLVGSKDKAGHWQIRFANMGLGGYPTAQYIKAMISGITLTRVSEAVWIVEGIRQTAYAKGQWVAPVEAGAEQQAA